MLCVAAKQPIFQRREGMEISLFDNGNGVLARLDGELDEYTAEHVRLSLDKVLDGMQAGATLTLDLGGVSFMDSTGIGVLLARYNKFSGKGIAIEIKNAHGHIDKILKMSGIYTLMRRGG